MWLNLGIIGGDRTHQSRYSGCSQLRTWIVPGHETRSVAALLVFFVYAGCFCTTSLAACFLGYTAITPAQKLHGIRMHAGYPNDWSMSYADSDLLNIITREIAFSQYLMDECATYDLRYFDTSQHFVQTLDQVVAYVRAE